MRAFLGYRRVVNHQHGIGAADEPIRLDKQFCFHWCRIPDPGGNEVVQLVAFAERKPLRHRLNALAIVWGVRNPADSKHAALAKERVKAPAEAVREAESW
jgi:hypothetical protein